MGCCSSRTNDSVAGAYAMEELTKSGNTLEIFRGPKSFKLFVTKHDTFQSKIHIPQMWLEAEHCVIHATGDLNVAVDGVRVEIPESQCSSKLNDLMLATPQSQCAAPQLPTIIESHKVGSLQIVADWLKTCQVTQFISETEFYVNFADLAEQREILSTILQESISGPLKRFPDKYEPGEHIVLSYNETNPCRGIISEKMSETTVVVKLPDTGKETIANLNMLTVLPTRASFLKYPPQAVRCSLKKTLFSKLEEHYLDKSATVGTHVKLHFGHPVDGVWRVNLLSNHNVNYIAMPQHERHNWKSINYAEFHKIVQEDLEECDKVVVSFFDKTKDLVWLHRSADLEDLQTLSDSANKNSAGAKVVDCHEVGQLYLCRSIEKSISRRGVIISISESLCEVFYPDYGNTEFLPKSAICSLPSSLKGFPRLIYCCRLDKKSMCKIDLFMEKQLEVTSCKLVGSVYKIRLAFKNQELHCVDTKLLQESQQAPVQIAKQDFDLDTNVETRLGFVAKDGALSLQLCDKSSQLENIMEKISKGDDSIGDIFEGRFCCSRFSADNSWYRAQISRIISNEEVEVVYIDHGNSEAVTTQRLKPLPQDCSLPSQAIQCVLHDDTHDSIFEGSSLSTQPWLYEGPLKGRFVQHAKFGLVFSEATRNGESVYAKLEANGVRCSRHVFKSESNYETFNIPELPLRSKAQLKFIIAEIDATDASVWIRCTENRTDFADIEASIECVIKDGQTPIDRQPKVDEYYLCHSTLYSQWYRSRITSVYDDRHCDVLYIDYGTCEKICLDSIAVLPHTLSTRPCQAVHCQLACLSGVSIDADLLSRLQAFCGPELNGCLALSLKGIQLEDVSNGHVAIKNQLLDIQATSPGNEKAESALGWSVSDSMCNGPADSTIVDSQLTSPKEASLLDLVKCNGTKGTQIRAPPRRPKTPSDLGSTSATQLNTNASHAINSKTLSSNSVGLLQGKGDDKL